MMMKTRITLMAALFLGFTLSAAQAEETGTGATEPSKGEIQAARQFKWLDRNNDGYLSREEVTLFPKLANAFDAADTNHDGLVSFEEIRAYAKEVREQRAHPSTSAKEATP